MHRDIVHQKVLIAQVYDFNEFKGAIFSTPPDATFQLGYAQIISEKKLVPHIHKRVERIINSTSEFIFVVSGKMVIKIYDEYQNYIDAIILTNNMGLLQFYGGHAIMIESVTNYFEIKQGPYYGRDFDKYDIKE